MKCPQIKINRQTDILCAHKVNNIYMHIKKTLYIIVLTICYVLVLIGKSYGQDLKIIDEDSVTILNSIKRGDFFYSVESQYKSDTIVPGTYNSFYQEILFTKRTIEGVLVKKIKAGDFYQPPHLIGPCPCFGVSKYNFYKIIEGSNNDFILSFTTDSVGYRAVSILSYRPVYYKILHISENTGFDTSTVYIDTHALGYSGLGYLGYNNTRGIYNPRNLVKTSNGQLVFARLHYKESDTTWFNEVLKIDFNGNILRRDLHHISKYPEEINVFSLPDTIAIFEHYKRDSTYLIKYDMNLNRIQRIKIANRLSYVYPFHIFSENNGIYDIKFSSSHDNYYSYLDNTSQGNGTISFYDIDGGAGFSTHNLNKLISEDKRIIVYSGYAQGQYNSENILTLYSKNPFREKFRSNIIPYKIKFSYRGVLKDAFAYITTYATENNDSCIYVFGQIDIGALNIYAERSFWFVKKVCGANKVITGNVFADFDNNCIKDTTERGLSEITVTVKTANYITYTTTDKNGNYVLNDLDTGYHTIDARANINYPYFALDSCSQTRIRTNLDSTKNVNLSLKPQFICPYNTVNVSSSPPFRIGQAQTYNVNYCNNGTVLSPNTYVTIKLDSLLDINGSSITYSTLPNHTYRFNIGNLDYLTCVSFSFVATPRIGAVQLNQTLCVEAHIYPDSVCTSPNYTGSFIVASAQCLGDSVELKLENRGGDMLVRRRYKVIEDQVMRINNEYQLPRNGTLIEKMPADSGHTYRIIAEQEDDLPASYGDKFATAAIEGCRPNPNDNFSTGFFAPFPDFDGEPFRDLSCNVITGAYDPNDKVASPLGYAPQHYIEKNTQIDYQINFQNTGNDTAFKVVLVDTISPNLDINSIQLGVASHAYQFQRTDSNVVQFVFDNILLVDSFRNEPKSHGFVKFKIQQKLNNPNGTKIYNKADIYFDYNAPVVTNQTYHTVGLDFITAQLISSVKNPKFNVKVVKVFPNPFREKTQIIVEAELLKNPVLLLMNVEGKIIKTILSSNNNTFDIYREDLTNGMYLFKIMQGNDEVANGKVMLQ